MKIKSLVFENNFNIPPKYTCDRENISPPLSFVDVPQSAKSLVLIMDDPDVPASAAVKVWDHWVIFNIPPSTKEIKENKNPQGVMGQNTRGQLSYGGPCPPDRQHRYFFKLYALDILLDLPEGSTKAQVEQAIQGHVIEKAELIGLYSRTAR